MALDRKDIGFKSKDKSALRAALIQTLFDDLSKYTLYPDHIMYSTVLSTLCCKYRFLRDDSQTGYATLLEILRNKFKKERKTLISVETVEDMKKKFGAVGRGRKRAPEQQQPLMEKRRESMQSEEFPGEDEHSTVHTRERMMEKKSTEEVLGLFPFLKHPKLLLHEVELRFGVNLERNLMSGLSRMVDPIFRLSSGHLLTTVMSYIEDASDKTQENGLRMNAALLLLPALFRERENLLFVVDQVPPSPTPTIVFKGTTSPLAADDISVCVDGIEILSDYPGMDITLAVECIFSLYFSLGIEYPKALKKILTFMERYFMKLSTSDKVPLPVLKMYSQITALLLGE
ncbi:uncharacterized protein LOC117416284 isoform X2 [Acipenser ruthenus]|uniref:uncharacterized protein LOC131736466 n=1 Tax=Acipenser ruthenus TaxID=7906 RepID=UPI0027420337|nr:uncharacterized protein LOC131736466 [Acipenser ruthenus]XP_058885969.1 uncharacterized protein LOC117416284 isoform X2 [Acipenser ruthenus]